MQILAFQYSLIFCHDHLKKQFCLKINVLSGLLLGVCKKFSLCWSFLFLITSLFTIANLQFSGLRVKFFLLNNFNEIQKGTLKVYNDIRTHILFEIIDKKMEVNSSYFHKCKWEGEWSFFEPTHSVGQKGFYSTFLLIEGSLMYKLFTFCQVGHLFCRNLKKLVKRTGLAWRAELRQSKRARALKRDKLTSNCSTVKCMAGPACMN